MLSTRQDIGGMMTSSRSRQDRKIKLRPLSWAEVKDLVDVQRYFNVPLGKQSAGETMILCLKLMAEQVRQAAAKKKEQQVEGTPDEQPGSSDEVSGATGTLGRDAQEDLATDSGDRQLPSEHEVTGDL